MTEFVSAEEYGMAILMRAMRTVAATRIQNTWRSCKVEQMAEVERARAKMHKIENSFGISWKNKDSDKIVDLLEEMEVKKEGSVITFGKENQAMMNNGSSYNEILDGEDGEDKGQTKFTRMVNSWFNYLGERRNFFNGTAKTFSEDPSSEDWMEYFNRVILLLENKVPVKLWADRGEFKNLYPKDKKKIIDLRDYWKLYLLKKEISMLKEFNDYKPAIVENETPVYYAYHV